MLFGAAKTTLVLAALVAAWARHASVPCKGSGAPLDVAWSPQQQFHVVQKRKRTV